MLAIAPTQKASVPTTVRNGSFTRASGASERSERVSLLRSWRLPAGGLQARAVDLCALGGGELLQVLVADGQWIVIGWGGLLRRGRRGSGGRSPPPNPPPAPR